MFAVLALRRVGVAGVAAGAVAVDARAVVPAARVLAEITAQRAGVANLWAGDAPGGARQQRIALEHIGIHRDLGERGERADLEAVGGLAHTLERRDAIEVDERPGMLGAILEPVIAVLATSQQPAAFHVLGQLERVFD